ncbi:MAG: hypothetical protein COY66_03780 [Candidatus Kerfeldbacteria bacterium CG_4_10_14_0_8_um_filter_42_10]|uniref:Transposase IS200-like domain-containing protein n=1 Tax=Candidatus Kerfeldbacteria bacterium CG_4_10_14_0_8_um_filter_42_10 TaxID=2014248 RepID=A0A2M7RJR7_9BACT|nr:MAG: hypothetical protein COY66_03780 [Candidatus Kerfeldbacteria bacterium CG_4_10_14_0_8_um_filter_42_10]
MILHRNSQKRYYSNQYTYFITTNAYKGYGYFENPFYCEILLDNLRIGRELKHFKLFAFNILPNHIHLLLRPTGKYNISEIMHNLKRVTSFQINNLLCPEGEDIYPRLQFRWQSSFYDHIIRNEKDFENHYRYTACNHLKHGLSNDWKYSSLNFKNIIDEME